MLKAVISDLSSISCPLASKTEKEREKRDNIKKQKKRGKKDSHLRFIMTIEHVYFCLSTKLDRKSDFYEAVRITL